jgi:hypothetical protein
LSSTGNEANFRTAAYEAITSYLTHATTDAIPVVQNTVVTILQRMEQLLGMQVRHFTCYDAYLATNANRRTKFLASMTGITGMNSRAISVVL